MPSAPNRRGTWTKRVFGAALLWIFGAPALNHLGAAPHRAVRGWHMFHDVGRSRCWWGLADASGARVWPAHLDATSRQAFTTYARAEGTADPAPLCALGWQPTLACLDDRGDWRPFPLALPLGCAR